MNRDTVRQTRAASLSRYSFLRLGSAALLALALLASGNAVRAQVAPNDAEAYITKLSETALSTLTQGSAEEREQKVQDLLRNNLALNEMAQFVLGSAWRKASETDRKEYTDLFSDFVVITYAKRLGGYSGQRFEIGGSTPIGKRDQLVSTRIEQEGAPPIAAGWRVRDSGGQLKIIDVVVEGVSMLRTERDQFASVLRSGGFEGVMTALKRRVDRLAG